MTGIDTDSAAAAAASSEYSAALACLRELWQTVLDVDDVSDTDNFFDLGGDSHGALRVWRLAAGLGMEMPRDTARATTANGCVITVSTPWPRLG